MSEQFDYDQDDEATVEDALERLAELGLDGERVGNTAAAAIEAGVHPVDALAEAVDSYDHSEAANELEALEKISAREGWS